MIGQGEWCSKKDLCSACLCVCWEGGGGLGQGNPTRGNPAVGTKSFILQCLALIICFNCLCLDIYVVISNYQYKLQLSLHHNFASAITLELIIICTYFDLLIKLNDTRPGIYTYSKTNPNKVNPCAQFFFP